MLLGNYFHNINKNYKNFYFSGISFDTNSIKKNNVFFAIKGNNFQSSLNQIKNLGLKTSIINIIFNKVSTKDWQKERIHSEQDNFDYIDGEDYKDATNTSLAEVTQRQLINLDSKYLLISFIDSCFQCPSQEIRECNSISIVKNMTQKI